MIRAYTVSILLPIAYILKPRAIKRGALCICLRIAHSVCSILYYFAISRLICAMMCSAVFTPVQL